MIKSLLVANRGEIACRIFQTCRELGIRTIAVYSDADAGLRFVREADVAIRLGPGPASESYLRADLILAAAIEHGADAIHPGYGFLSERAEFAEACIAAGIRFVGPSGAAMRKLGTKADAKALARLAEVPSVPGFEGQGRLEELQAAAVGIGYPVMLKASSGGGGRGMRIVHDPSAFADEFHLASDEALKSFGDGTMLVEKYVRNPRHVEVQFIADGHGNVATLFERECSIQRRHQKLIEEAPAAREVPWEAMREATRKLVLAAEYENAGTAEFIVDPETDAFYFLEVNARLQVEHPVTEAITGVDLVAEQIRVASGLPLSFPQRLIDGERSEIFGHAIEARIVAENPGKGFVPSLGKIRAWLTPRNPHIRVDSGFEVGDEVSRFYDSMLAKIIAHGPDRATAVHRLRAALLDLHILGVDTNAGLIIDLLADETFRSGHIHTGTLATFLETWSVPEPGPELALVAAKATQPLTTGPTTGPAIQNDQPAWSMLDGFRNARP